MHFFGFICIFNRPLESPPILLSALSLDRIGNHRLALRQRTLIRRYHSRYAVCFTGRYGIAATDGCLASILIIRPGFHSAPRQSILHLQVRSDLASGSDTVLSADPAIYICLATGDGKSDVGVVDVIHAGCDNGLCRTSLFGVRAIFLRHCLRHCCCEQRSRQTYARNQSFYFAAHNRKAPFIFSYSL